MVGLGETSEEVIETMNQVYNVGVTIFTIGQYLRPTKDHLEVKSYVSKAVSYTHLTLPTICSV